MKKEDIYGAPCGCGECIQAGVAHEQTRRDPYTGKMLHGYELRKGLDAFKRFQELARAAVGPRGRRASGFEKLAKGNE
jgi:hypothetical protein